MTDELGWRARVETKLDQIAQALTVLARVEERQAHHREEIDSLKKKSDDHDKRLGALEREDAKTGVRLGFGERVWWLLVTAALGGGWIVHLSSAASAATKAIAGQ